MKQLYDQPPRNQYYAAIVLTLRILTNIEKFNAIHKQPTRTLHMFIRFDNYNDDFCAV